MKDENIIIILYLILSVFIICAAVAHIFLGLGKSDIERAPAVYYIKRVDVKSESEKYNIYQDEQLIAIVNLQLEDFEHDLQ